MLLFVSTAGRKRWFGNYFIACVALYS